MVEAQALSHAILYDTDIHSGAAVCYLGNYSLLAIPFYLKIVNYKVKKLCISCKIAESTCRQEFNADESLMLMRVYVLTRI